VNHIVHLSRPYRLARAPEEVADGHAAVLASVAVEGDDQEDIVGRRERPTLLPPQSSPNPVDLRAEML